MARLKHIFVISAPSGAGKTTLNRRLVEAFPEVEISVSLTTRAKRVGEQDGLHYHFVTKEYFEGQIAHGNMLEWANVHGNLYGTSKLELAKIASRNHCAILEIDVQGWLNARAHLQRVTSIFILPPSMDVLWQRLLKRGSDTPEVCWQRFLTARQEIATAQHYDHFLVNDAIEKAYEDLVAIVIGGQSAGLTSAQGAKLCQNLDEEFTRNPQILELKEQFLKKG